ncbi:MAG: NADH-dependent alcohol dehydrogenase, partial [Rickettsiaceae bacterium]|nr:NADH-dependent alcohol dehydrogenase [Rickettsiaceae bacterium]
EAAIQKTEAFFNSLDIPTRIGDYEEVKKEELKDIVANLEKHGMVALSEPGELTLDVAERIIENAY